MTFKSFHYYFESHLAIDIAKFAREAKIARTTLEEIIRLKKKPQQRTLDKLLPVMKKYGYKP